jgi:hypothetical protein
MAGCYRFVLQSFQGIQGAQLVEMVLHFASVDSRTLDAIFVGWTGPVAEVEVHIFLLGLGKFLGGDDGEGAEEKVGGVSHDGGTARSDFVTGLEFIEFAEGMVDVGGGEEFLDIADEGGGEVGLVEICVTVGSMFGAEAGGGVGDRETATATGGGALLAMGQNGGRGAGRTREFRSHDGSFREVVGDFRFGNCWYTPRQFS